MSEDPKNPIDGASTHEKLVVAFLKYCKEQDAFEERFSWRTHRGSRRYLRQLLDLAQTRKEEIHRDWKLRRTIKPKKTK